MTDAEWQNHLEVEGEGLMRIRKHGKMNVDAMIVSNPEHLAKSSDERSLSQLVNIASMPGIVGEAGLLPYTKANPSSPLLKEP